MRLPLLKSAEAEVRREIVPTFRRRGVEA